jgi:hypothetical protein
MVEEINAREAIEIIAILINKSCKGIYFKERMINDEIKTLPQNVLLLYLKHQNVINSFVQSGLFPRSWLYV